MANNYSHLLEPEQLASRLGEDNLLIVDLCSDQQYAEGHVPGAVHVSPGALMDGRPPAPGKLPTEERLSELVTLLGLGPNTHVVIYDDEGGGWAGRMAWTLDVLGHTAWSYLNGGLIAWAREGYPLETRTNVQSGEPRQVTIHHEPIAELDDIIRGLDTTELRIWDARSRDEYLGIKSPSKRAGHIPGAIHCEWTALMDPERHFRIRSDAGDYLANIGLTPDHDIITHCQSHHRSGFTYMVARILGYPRIRGYHGSWSEWGNRDDTPIETGAVGKSQ